MLSPHTELDSQAGSVEAVPWYHLCHPLMKNRTDRRAPGKPLQQNPPLHKHLFQGPFMFSPFLSRLSLRDSAQVMDAGKENQAHEYQV